MDNIIIFIMIFYAFLIPANLIMTGLYLDEANYSYEEILKKINDKPNAYSISKWKAKIEHKKHYLYNIYTSIALSVLFVILIIIVSKYSQKKNKSYTLQLDNILAQKEIPGGNTNEFLYTPRNDTSRDDEYRKQAEKATDAKLQELELVLAQIKKDSKAALNRSSIA
jgi:hypothetical protein